MVKNRLLPPQNRVFGVFAIPRAGIRSGKKRKITTFTKIEKNGKKCHFWSIFLGGGGWNAKHFINPSELFPKPEKRCFFGHFTLKNKREKYAAVDALTTGYAQFVQASYLLLPIFGKSTIFGIFRKSGKIGFFGHFLSIFGHFLTIFDKIFIWWAIF
jgi:hypothetical protein